MTTPPRRASAAASSTTAPPTNDDALITSVTARELAGGISAMTLWRWRKAGLIPDPIAIRGRNYWRRSPFVAALARAGSQRAVESEA